MSSEMSVGFLEHPTRTLFFTGKGGTGKTSIACASATALAAAGRRVLLVSTDPASNLSEVLQTEIGRTPTPVAGRPGLDAIDIDPEAAAAAYRERVVGPYRDLLPATAVASIEEQLSGACTVEIAAFDEFATLLGSPEATAGYDHVIFDTAPTGHTLRLLRLPSAWSEFIATNTTGTSCLGPLAGLESQRSLYDATFAALTDPARTAIVLVSRPEPSALAEADRSRGELAELGIENQRLALNGVFHASDRSDTLALALENRQRQALESIPSALGALARTTIPLLPFAPLGVEALARVFDSSAHAPDAPTALAPPAPEGTQRLETLVDELAAPGHGLIMTMGKGGVGKTTIAAAIAVELARRGHPVHLSTTDPAAHVAQTIGEQLHGLKVSRIDPAVETRAYSEAILAEAGSDLDANARALLEEDLRSPCTEEIAVFRAFARTVADAQEGFVVLDTAPTGHTLLLLDAAQAYHREIARTSNIPQEITDLLPRLRNPEFARVLLVTLPEATPVHEAAQLAEDLRRAEITPYAWIVNQSLSHARPHDPVLAQRALAEHRYIKEVLQRSEQHTAIVGWQPQPPVGATQLTALLAAA
jgi:arsenite-transporting ATPase